MELFSKMFSFSGFASVMHDEAGRQTSDQPSQQQVLLHRQELVHFKCFLSRVFAITNN